MAFVPWKTLSSRALIKYRIWDYMEDEVELPNGRQTTYQYIKNSGIVTIVPVDTQGNLIVIKQYRYLLGGESLEFPAGYIEGGIEPIEAAQSELIEEVGHKADKLEFVGKSLASTSAIQGFAHVYLATELVTAHQELEDTEQIEILTMTPQDFDRAVVSGEVVAGHVLMAWALVRNRILSL